MNKFGSSSYKGFLENCDHPDHISRRRNDKTLVYGIVDIMASPRALFLDQQRNQQLSAGEAT
jgi:hypothetical protein